MAGSTIKQVIPVDLVVSIKNAVDVTRGLKKNIEDALSGIDPGSSLGKSLTKTLNDVTKKITQLDALTGKSFFSDKDLRASLSALDQISTKMAQIKAQTAGASVQALGLDTGALQKAQEALNKLLTQAKNQRGQAVGGVLSSDAALMKRLNASQSKTGFDPAKSFIANINKFQGAIGSLNAKFIELASAAESAAKKVQSSQNELKNAQASVVAPQNAYTSARTAYGEYQAATLFSGIKGTYKGRGNEQIAADYQDAVRGLVQDGKFVEGGAEIAETLGKWLKIDPAQLQGPAQNIVDSIISAIGAAAKDGKAFTNLRQEVRKQDVKNRDGASIIATYNTAKTALDTAQQDIAAAQAQLNVDTADSTAAQNALNNTKNTLQEISNLLAILIQQKGQLEQSVDQKFSKPIQDAKDNIKAIAEQEKAPTVGAVGQAADKQNIQYQNVYQQAMDYQANLDLQERQKRQAEQAAREQQQFTNQLNQSITRWMSAGQIIQYIKSGIREAWQDVQSLDKAMTNIAVVTDMSVSDLWGKINEYMSIAKEYGVTTQGVYEVSQLFFQQGLSANDVMAATTETLKMARVAGIQYKDAADGMTVAIRAFRMEMEQASHVTDVYSKVAAVTASDTEELITAMSKTASSAEAVGSSFENTTAMLAVMIESTRESATNIGSAMKSIISR